MSFEVWPEKMRCIVICNIVYRCYDLPLRSAATHLFRHLEQIAKVREAALIFVQAIAGEEHALGFYRSFADTEVVVHQFEVQMAER